MAPSAARPARRSTAQPPTRPRTYRWRWLAGGTVLLLAAAGAAGLWLHEPPERRKGLELLKRGQPEQAAPLLHRALERHPDDIEVLQGLAQIEMAAQQPRDARIYLTRWCQLRPDDPEPYQLRMEAAIQSRDFPEAAEDGLYVLRLQPDNEQVRRQVAPLLLITGQLDEAERQCRRCLLRQPDEPELCYLLADICHHQGNNDEAASVLDALLRRQPQYAAACLLRGTLYYEADQPARAIPWLEKATQLNLLPAQQIEAHYQLSLALARTDRQQDALRALADMQWRQALDLAKRKEHQGVPVLLRVADALIGVGKAPDAVALLEKISEQDPNCIPEAIRLLEKIVAQDPGAAAAAHRVLAACYERQGQAARAAEQRRLAGP